MKGSLMTASNPKSQSSAIGAASSQSAQPGPNPLREIALKDVRGIATKEERELLRLPENQVEWRDELLILAYQRWFDLEDAHANGHGEYLDLEKVDPMLAALALQAWEKKASKAARFLSRIETRIAEVDRLLDARADELTEVERRMRFLEKSIATHKEQMLAWGEKEFHPLDQALWDALDGKWSFSEAPEDEIE